MKMKYLVGLLFILSTGTKADSFLDSVKREVWGDMDVVWIEDDKFPRYSATFYFQDGALSDPFPGLTQATLDQLSSGSSKESQREIAEFFDFYGTKIKNSVTHEFNTYSVQGLTKDVGPVMTKVCELFKDAQYPKKELTSYISRSKSHLKNLVTSHSGLADRVFRQLSLLETPYAKPADGTLSSFDKLTPMGLKDRLTQLNRSRKVLYLSGPESVHEMKDIILKKCPWSSQTVSSKLEIKKPGLQSAIYLIPVPGANQAQIRIGRFVTAEEFNGKMDNLSFLAGFLGGGFTSKLVQELRVKRGLTYSAGAYVSMQRDYGRAGVMTFSKTETAAEVISIIRDLFQDINTGKFEQKEFDHQKGHQIGGFPFSFEESSALLMQVLIYDHQMRNLKELANFRETISGLTPQSLIQANIEAFPWDKLTIVVVGDKNLEKSLSRIRPVKILDYSEFL